MKRWNLLALLFILVSGFGDGLLCHGLSLRDPDSSLLLNSASILKDPEATAGPTTQYKAEKTNADELENEDDMDEENATNFSNESMDDGDEDEEAGQYIKDARKREEENEYKENEAKKMGEFEELDQGEENDDSEIAANTDEGKEKEEHTLPDKSQFRTTMKDLIDVASRFTDINRKLNILD